MARGTKAEALATREALLDAAERVFEQRGVTRSTLADIAAAAGVTRGALYWHFEGKGELFNAMMERVTLPLQSELADVAMKPGDPIDALMHALERALEQIASDERTQRVLTIANMMVELVDELLPVRERYAQMERADVLSLQRVLERAGAQRKQALAAPAAQLAHGLHAMVRGLVDGWLLHRNFDLQATTRAAVLAYLRGIGLPPRSQALGNR